MGDPSNIDIGWRTAVMLAACTPVILAAIMLIMRRVERQSNMWLALFLMIAVVAQIPQIIGFAGFYDVWPGLTFAPFNVELYAGPLIYLHADRLMRGGQLGWRKYLLVPGLVQTSYYTWAFLFLGDYKSKWAFVSDFHAPYVSPVETLIGVGMVIFAIIAISRMIGRYRVYLENTQSATRDFDPVWLQRLLIAASVAITIFISVEISTLIMPSLSFVDVFPAQVVLTAVIAWLGFEAVSKTNVTFPKMIEGRERDEPLGQISNRDWKAEGEQLRTAVLDKGWYLEPRLSIRDLANRMGSNETYISRALNQGLGLSFNRFINGLRVAKAQQLIAEGGMSMIETAHESGFNSKATFNRVFRDSVGVTPSAYKSSQKT